MSFRVLTLTTTFLVAATATAADWPQWRGPNRDGISAETGLLKKWPESGPPLVWTAKDLGMGFGTPTVADGKVFGIGTRNGKDGIWAVTEADGKLLWFTPFADTAAVKSNTNGPSNCPTFHNGKLYTSSLGGTVACLDAGSGKVLWTKNYVKDFGGQVPIWGFSDSVLVDGDKVICAPCGPKTAVAALKAATGDVVWAADLGKIDTQFVGGAGYSSPIKVTVGDVPMYVTVLDKANGIVGLAPDTGKVLWKYNKAAMGGTAQIPTPVVKGDRVWVSTGYGGGSALLKLTPKGKDEVSVEEVKTYKAQLLNHHGGMVLVGDHVYFGHGQNQGNPACVDFKTGELKWGPEKSPAGGDRSAAVTYADGRLYFRYENGVMVLIEPSPEELKVVSSFKLPAPSGPKRESWPHPVIANGKLYVRDQNVMYCYNVKAAGADN